MSVVPRPRLDLVRHLLVIVIIGLLILGSLYVLRPFMAALIWATMITVATWPLLLKLQRRLGNRRGLAVLAMMVAMLLIIVAPLAAAVVTIVDHTDAIHDWVAGMPSYTLPPPPEWVTRIPLAGKKLAAEWQTLSDAGPGGVLARIKPHAAGITNWALAQMGSIGGLVLHLVLTTIITGILYAQGESAADGIVRFARRVSGHRGEIAVELAAKSIRAVALGIITTAVIQSVLGGLGLLVAGVPLAGLLTAVMLILCIAQLGPGVPLLIGIGWLYWQDHTVAAIALFVWAIFVGTIDNVIRPVLIKRGADLPFLLILAGVIGGLFAFGLVGLFVGPVLLAVTFTLLQTWIDEPPPDAVLVVLAPDETTSPPAE
ncbi:MAG TPA: AI-2E family transporter YdiK [Dyella sp.]|uniref:AI-2E family transporter YdiK n=1 Tax=Dyella sp. TaxID=1869338 RepID=UPI002D7940EE|nr:AI-2E family transporter YdiK [Dyella sp.]HET6552765.1 AI-2E family transporter YdiK [Dyella sp.]